MEIVFYDSLRQDIALPLSHDTAQYGTVSPYHGLHSLQHVPKGVERGYKCDYAMYSECCLSTALRSLARVSRRPPLSRRARGTTSHRVRGIGTRLTDGRAVLYILRLRLRPVSLLWIKIYSIPLGLTQVLTQSILAGAWLSHYLVDP